MAETSIPVETRTCTRCHHEYPATTEHFARQKNGHLGLSSWCKGCRADYQREYLAIPHNREKHRQYIASYRMSNPTFVENQRELGREYRRKKRESGEQYVYQRAWFKTPKGKRLRHIHGQIRYARKKSVSGQYGAADIDIMLRSQKNKCWWCGNLLDNSWHIDHRIPLSRGGSNDASNLCITCPHCNLSKRDKLPHEWGDRLL